MDLSKVAERMEPSIRVTGAFLRIRERIAELFPNELPVFGAAVPLNNYLHSAIRCALHTYGNAREDSISTEDFALAIAYVQREMNAVLWIRSNPHYAQQVATETLKGHPWNK